MLPRPPIFLPPQMLLQQQQQQQQPQQTKFQFEDFLEREYQFGLNPDRPKQSIHPNYSNKIVCKHWLRGLCKKNLNCEFLHEYNLRKMPECLFFSKNGFCTQSPDCLYLHIDPKSKIPECDSYKKGFCKDGPNCTKRHVRKTACPNYLYGFCPDGPDCSMTHPKMGIITDRMKFKSDDELFGAPEEEKSGDDEDKKSSTTETETPVENTEK